MNLSERLVPHSLEAEKAVLGSIMLDNSLYDQSARFIKTDDFYLDSHRNIFRAFETISKMHSSGAIDLVTLVNALQTITTIEEIGGKAYLSSLIDSLPRYSNIEQYAGIIAEKSRLRKVISLCEKTKIACYQAQDSYINIFESFEKNMTTINSEQKGGIKLEMLSEYGGMKHQDLEKMEKFIGQKDEFGNLDHHYFVEMPYEDMHRFQLFPRKTLGVIAARTSMGKSMFCVDTAIKLAKQGNQIAFFTKEDVAERIRTRMIANLTQISLRSLHAKRLLDKAEFDRYKAGVEELISLPIAITSSDKFEVSEMIAMARAHHRKHGLDVIFVDYLQKFGSGFSVQRVAELGNIVDRLQSLSRELNCVIVLVSQLNRGATQTDERGRHRRPAMMDLRESGKIEDSADWIVLIHRKGYYDEDKSGEMGETEIIICKNKNGTIGLATLDFSGEFQTVSDIDPFDKVPYNEE